MKINLDIKARVFLLAFVPMLFITVILSFYFLYGQLEDIDSSINDRGTAMVKHLATASEFGMFSGNIQNLNNILQQSILEEEGIVYITITDNSGRSLVSAINNELKAKQVSNGLTNFRLFRHPITLHTTEIAGVDEVTPISESADKNEILGWVEASISTHQINQRQDKIIRDSAAIIFSGLIASILLSLWIGRILTSPIIRLTKSVNRVENGNLDEIIETNSSGEIGMLEKGFMSMLGKIRHSQKDLQKQINKTTLGLQNSLKIVEKQNLELTLARTKALEASEAKSRFLANISHEIRTPMNGILGFARLLKKTSLNKEQYDYLDTIEKSSNNLLSLIEDILDLSRVEEGKIVIKNQTFNLRDCIEDIIMLMAPEVLVKGLDITYFYYNDVPSAITAPNERIRQVLINYIGNAIKFSEMGTIVVRVMLDHDSDNSLRISVSDQGIGIPDTEKEHIFSPFTQIDDTSTRKYGGSGLGLAISKSITRAIGGDVGLENNADHGSTFWFSFPYQEVITNHDTPNISLLSHDTPVFLYDCNPDTLSSIHADVKDAGYTVHDSGNLNELADKITDNQGISIGILSLSHNEIDNHHSESIIQKLSSFPEVRLFLLISSIDQSVKKKAKIYGADACLTKPYRHNELIKILSCLSNTDNNESISVRPGIPAEHSAQSLDGVNILLAEDNAINTKLIQTILADTGANIKHAENGMEAVDYYRNNEIDIILMDIQMPKMNGIDATDNIRNLEPGKNEVPIIGMTANALPEDITAYKNSGFNDILIKPIAVDDLFHQIQYWLQQTNNFSDTKYNKHVVDPENNEKNIDNLLANSSQLGISNKLSNDLYNMLVDELPQIESLLKESFSLQDWDSLRKQTHKLLGGISYCNVPELKKKAISFHESLKSRSETITNDFEALITEIEKIS